MAKIDHKPTQNERIIDYIKSMDILEMCEKETGINVMNKVSEKDG